MLFALLAVVSTILAIGFQTIAAATPEQVNFYPVKIRNGAKIHVNGDKTLTAIDNGNKLVADNTNGTAVKGDQIESELNSFVATNYGDDAFFKSNVANNPASLSEAELNAFRHYLPVVDNDYWLSDTSSKYGFDMIGVAGNDNTMLSVKHTLAGKTQNGSLFVGDDLYLGSFDFASDFSTLDFDQPSETYLWSISSNEETILRGFELVDSIINKDNKVYNNPYCIEDPLRGFYSFAWPIRSSAINGKVIIADGVPTIKSLGFKEKITDSDVAICAVYGGSAELIKNLLHFQMSSTGNFSIYFKVQGSSSVAPFGGATPLTAKGVHSWTDKERKIQGRAYEGAEHVVRPLFDINHDSIVLSRSASCDTSLNPSSIFTSNAMSNVSYNEDAKLVVESSDTSITSSISEDKLSTEKAANNHAATKYTNGVIQVPYGAKTLTIDSSAFNASNANYISALANVNGTQKYVVLGRPSENLEIDLASIVNNNQVGSKATVSFYAEQANPANTSDVISETSVTVEIEVVAGPEQTIRYDLGGGTGILPSSAIIRSGKSYAMADGSGLIKDGNLFSCWQLSYTPYGESDEVTRLVKGNESVIIPDSISGTIKATAMYSGVNATKTTSSKPSVVTVTWDSNAPEGVTATFTDSTGTYNDDKSIRYDKIKVVGTPLSVPSAPSLNTETWVFDGWYTESVGGQKITVSVNPSDNTTYYAHWINGYSITYDASGGLGATITGAFSDGSITDQEIVLPGNNTVGPKKGDPKSNDASGLYEFKGWFSRVNGAGSQLKIGETISSSMTVYAYYELTNTFLAPKT